MCAFGWGVGLSTKEHNGTFQGKGKVLNLNLGGTYTTVCIC